MVRERWSWRELPVKADEAHFQLRHSSHPEEPAAQWLLVALIGPPANRTFPVQWLLDAAEPAYSKAVRAVRRELDFYLVDKGELDPWNYAKYHCGTMANVYSDVHWSFRNRGKGGKKS